MNSGNYFRLPLSPFESRQAIYQVASCKRRPSHEYELQIKLATMKSNQLIRDTQIKRRLTGRGIQDNEEQVDKMNTNTNSTTSQKRYDLRREALPLEACAIINSNNLSSSPATSQDFQVSFVHTRQHMTNRRDATQLRPSPRFCFRRAGNLRSDVRPRVHSAVRPTIANLLVALAMLSCIFITTTTQAADSVAELKPLGSSPASQLQDSSKPNSNERSDESPVSAKSAAEAPSQSGQTSIAASLSSAVASAAAAVAVAAAQGSLSGGDARSLLSAANGGGQRAQSSHSHAQRPPAGLHLAMKFADAIPEVPYSILHNMKKLDHAAPFYNVPNKLPGATKESGQSFIGSALGSPGATDQLSALFRSPFWKRIADGYGEFTSEFRSLFRMPSATPMKGPSSSTGKLLRDISVPALLMLIASTIPSDWRPVRTRRKSFAPVDIQPSALAHLAAPATSEFHFQQTGSSPALSSPFRHNLDMNNFASNSQIAYPGAGHSTSIQRQPPADINLQADESTVRGSWLSAQQAQAATSGSRNHLDVHQQANNFQSPQQYSSNINHNNNNQQQHSIRRSGELLIPSTSSSSLSEFGDQKYHQTQEERELKPVKSGQEHATGSLVGSLTSGFVQGTSGSGKLMSRILNANLNNLGNSYRMMGLVDNQINKRLWSSSPLSLSSSSSDAIKRDQLGNRQRYTLIGLDDNNHLSHSGGAIEQPKLSSPSSKPFLLSAMTHAITSMLNQPLESGSSSPVGQNSFLRRQTQVTHSASGGQMEQRDLTKLLPESWREVVKRTMTTVQQQANVQWKSIEGQLANWVQDKLKAAANSVGAAAAGSASSSSPSSSSSSSGLTSTGGSGATGSSASAPVANILATVGSTAMNILGLGAKNTANSSLPSTPTTLSSSPSATVHSGGQHSHQERQTATSAVSKSKTEKPGSQTAAPSKGPLAGMAGLIMNTLTNRSSAPTSSSSTSSSTSSFTSADSADQTQRSPLAADSTGGLSSVASQYPTLTGAHPAGSDSQTAGQSPSTAGSLPSLALAVPTSSDLAASTTPSS